MNTLKLGLGALVCSGVLGLGRLSEGASPIPRRISGPTPGLNGPPHLAANGPSTDAVISRDGRTLVFASSASNLVTNDYNGLGMDVFVRDLEAGKTTLISASTDGRPAHGESWAPDVSGDGRHVAFLSTSLGLVSNDSRAAQPLVFVHDRLQRRTRLVSPHAGPGADAAECRDPRLTPDGKYVFFLSRASAGVAIGPDVPGRMDLFRVDLNSGEMVAVTRGAADVPVGLDVREYHASDDGRWVAFVRGTSDIRSEPLSSGTLPTTAFVRDLSLGVARRLELQPGAVLGPTLLPVGVVSLRFAPGRARLAVLFEAGDPGTASSGSSLLQVLDLDENGMHEVAHKTVAASFGWWRWTAPEFSADGRVLACLQPNALDGHSSVVLWKEGSGFVGATGGTNSWNTNGILRASEVALSPDGRYLALTCLADEQAQGGALSDPPQLYLVNVEDGRTELISADSRGRPRGVGDWARPVFSPDGRSLIFQSLVPELDSSSRVVEENLVALDLETHRRTVITSPVPGSTWRARVLTSLGPRGMSADGRLALFGSTADDLVADDTGSLGDLFIRDLETGEIEWVTVPGQPVPGVKPGYAEAALSANGRFVAYVADAAVVDASGAQVTVPEVLVRDLAWKRTRFTTLGAGGRPLVQRYVMQLRISADGRRVAYMADARSTLGNGSTSGLHLCIVRDWVGGRTWTLYRSSVTPRIQLSADGTRLLSRISGSFMVWDPDVDRRLNIPDVVGFESEMSADGRRVVWLARGTGSTPFEMRWLHLETGQQSGAVLPFSATPDPILQALSADGLMAIVRGSVASPQQLRTAFCRVDLRSGRVSQLDVGSASVLPIGPLSRPSVTLSADGSCLAWQSAAQGLVPNDPSDAYDLFIQLTPDGPIQRLAQSPGELDSMAGRIDGVHRPLVSLYGNRILFLSGSRGFDESDMDQCLDAFVLDLEPRPFQDDDGDGLEDRWEVAWFGNLDRTGLLDRDGDGASDADEFRAGTVPLDDQDLFRVGGVRLESGRWAVRWNSRRGRTYRVESMDRLGEPWRAEGAEMDGDGRGLEWVIPESAATTRFVRVQVRLRAAR